mmetsp:Transcript_18095/g.31006  ORF Transcript_18095/g.31006 Transcript_18095/m.31006 type:complete len:475 (+) Transcript_18095:223-1647(+)|eukprot:CAMPEP_0119107602 /NCGR_PEP_ID=MMETSP1180-20130426/11494_1 /TAXON_ID=3052 ORGANISM="Chlamydomonas cf sp, Strain CCMP681" /NCGR_SAMPLE_ID=MMETSP1180 /ASSEMBLY_ACC=CAM_ASM_000741 /LENGTH=474 /DNA_ID=CAMNT_0007093117 /DNA_START=221 /DNA_END=1645 /DNA_ORIENTATION=-
MVALDENMDDEVVERDPDGRYMRYRATVGKGRFKNVFKAFDTVLGIDVAWSKISTDSSSLHLTEQHLAECMHDIRKGLELEHPNIIKCYKCWEDRNQHCINLVTELFTSGNLRQYRNQHKHLAGTGGQDMKAVKRIGRQILRGLEYLHSLQPPVAHGDLRCDKIYVNGNSGEIKIGDLGLATLLPYRYEAQAEQAAQYAAQQAEAPRQQEGQQGPGEPAAAADSAGKPAVGTDSTGAPCNCGVLPTPTSLHDPSADIFAFGLCMLELLTLKQLDPQHCHNLQDLINEVQDEECKQFICKCIAAPGQRPTAEELLEQAFLSAPVVKKPIAGLDLGDMNSSLNGSSKNLHDTLEKRKTEDQNGVDSQDGPMAAVGKLRGEDYNFEFHGKVKDGKMHFRLVMTEAAVADPGDNQQPFMRTIDFVYDPEIDTADRLAAEISENFNLSPTDTEICAAALREWLAREMPGEENSSRDHQR